MVGTQSIRINEGKSFDPVPEDKYQVQVTDVEAVIQMNYQGTQEEERLRYTFTILDPDKTMQDEAGNPAPLRGRKLWSRFTKVLSLPGASKASNLTKLIAAVFGRELERAELEVFEPEDIIGKQLSVMVNQTKSKADGNIYNNIISFSKAGKEMEPWTDDGKGTKPPVRKSQPATTASKPEDFEKEMDELAAKRAKE